MTWQHVTTIWKLDQEGNDIRFWPILWKQNQISLWIQLHEHVAREATISSAERAKAKHPSSDLYDNTLLLKISRIPLQSFSCRLDTPVQLSICLPCNFIIKTYCSISYGGHVSPLYFLSFTGLLVFFFYTVVLLWTRIQTHLFVDLHWISNIIMLHEETAFMVI